MSQCKALFFETKGGVGWYCVLHRDHKSDHRTDKGRIFHERDATYIKREPKTKSPKWQLPDNERKT